MNKNIQLFYSTIYDENNKYYKIKQSRNRIKVVNETVHNKVLSEWRIKDGFEFMMNKLLWQFDICTNMTGAFTVSWVKGYKSLGLHFFPSRSEDNKKYL